MYTGDFEGGILGVARSLRRIGPFPHPGMYHINAASSHGHKPLSLNVVGIDMNAMLAGRCGENVEIVRPRWGAQRFWSLENDVEFTDRTRVVLLHGPWDPGHGRMFRGPGTRGTRTGAPSAQHTERDGVIGARTLNTSNSVSTALAWP